MACLSNSNDVVAADSGAFEINKNVATIAGGVCLASGGALALGIGTAVAPLPVVGLSAAGAGLLVTGSYKDVKEFFSKDEKPARHIPEAGTVEEDGYASVEEMSEHLDETTPVNAETITVVPA